MKKVCFITFGCRLNRAEALDMEARYLANGWELTDDHKEANLFVVRGCSVTERAQHDCEKLIDHLRRHYPHTALQVTGCLKDKFRLSRGTGTIEKFADATSPAPVPTRTARAYLKVQDGCSGACTFCIVPKFRGKSVSVPFEDVLDKARRFIDAGYHEIVVTGCNLSLYASEGKRLPDLIAALAELGAAPDPTDGCRIRLGSLEPGDCATETVRTMAEHANVCRFLHLPIQSGSDRILASMRRPYRVKNVLAVIDAAVRAMPSIGLGCDLMTGFPGETEYDQIGTVNLLTAQPFSNVHIFPYSERPGTIAANLPDRVPRSVRSARARALLKIANDKRRTLGKGLVGKTVDVIIEDEAKQAGWTSEYFWYEPYTLRSGNKKPRKSILRVRALSYEHGCLR